jgi:hypothetical protein
MNSQVIIWSAVMLLLLVGFILRVAVTARLTSGNTKIFEVSDEFDLYDWNEDEV